MPGGGISGMVTHAEPKAVWPGPILLDISRSVSRWHLPAPTGIDRVEAAYLARLRSGTLWGFARIAGGFVLLDPAGIHALETRAQEAALDLRGHWPRGPVAVRRIESLLRRLARGRSNRAGLARMLCRHLPPGTLALTLGHSNLSLEVMEALKAAEALRVVMIHDTIPLDRPDLSASGATARFQSRLKAAGQADLLLTNSQHTAQRAAHWFSEFGMEAPASQTLPLGTDPPNRHWCPAERPSFVILGTVEPRKGHALLLDVWSGWGDAAPRLHIVGRLGWIGAALKRRILNPPASVTRHGALDNKAAQDILASAWALLMPSLAEGYGLPLAEARAMGLPALVSDLPALRETGGGWPVFLPPRDPAAWRVAIERHSTTPVTQLTRNQGSDPIFWPEHFTKLVRILSKFRRV